MNPFWPPVEYDGEGRTECCGAPLDGEGEPTVKFYERHVSPWRGLRKRFRGCGSGMRKFVL